MRKECRIKTFGLGPFFCVCRMIQHEPKTNTAENSKSETVASSVALCEPQLEHAESSLTEEFIEGRHFVCVIDKVNHEYVRGFKLRLIWKDHHRIRTSGYVLTPEHERDEAMLSDLEKKSFLRNLNQIFQKILKNPSCWRVFCGSTKLVATCCTRLQLLYTGSWENFC